MDTDTPTIEQKPASKSSQPFAHFNFQATNITPNLAADASIPTSDTAQKALAVKANSEGVYPYSAEAAELNAIASAWAYSDIQMLSNIMKQAGLTNNAVDEIHIKNGALFLDTQAYLIRDPDKHIAILAFRGTELGSANYIDMLTDINVNPIEFPPNNNTYVHGGFYRGLLAAWPKLMETLNECCTENDTITDIYITGHSLGGALACLATAAIFLDTQGVFYGIDQLRDKLNFRGLYTYGQPMIGDHNLAKLCEHTFGDRVFRHIYNRDLTPRLPSRTVGRFKHFGEEYRCNRKEPWHRSFMNSRPVLTVGISLPIAMTAFFAQQFGFSQNLPFSVSLADHFPQNYINAGKRVNADINFP